MGAVGLAGDQAGRGECVGPMIKHLWKLEDGGRRQVLEWDKTWVFWRLLSPKTA